MGYLVQPKRYRRAVQEPIPADNTPPATKEEWRLVQQVVESIIYYAKGFNLTALTGLSTLVSMRASEQAKEIGQTVKNMGQMLDYLVTNLDATLWYCASDMILNIHSDASYVSESGTVGAKRWAITLWDVCQWPMNWLNSTTQSTYHTLHNCQICSSISSRGRVKSVMFEYQTRTNHAANTWRDGTLTATNFNQHRQFNSSGDSQWHSETTKIVIDGDAILLLLRSSEEKSIRCTISFRAGELRGLHFKASQIKAPQGRTTNLLTHAELTPHFGKNNDP